MKFGIFACQQEFYPQLVEGVDEKSGLRTAFGFWGSLLGGCPKIMQDMHRQTAGIRLIKHEYIRSPDFVHMSVDGFIRLSTDCPLPKRQDVTGVDAFFPIFHSPYY